jgi:hypothetical protein
MLILLVSHDHKLLIIHLVKPTFFFIVIIIIIITIKRGYGQKFFFSSPAVLD